MARLVQPVDDTASEGEEKMKTKASDYTVQLEISGPKALCAEGKIQGLSGRRTSNNKLSSQRVVLAISREADE